jgi:hypothetical protein
MRMAEFSAEATLTLDEARGLANELIELTYNHKENDGND